MDRQVPNYTHVALEQAKAGTCAIVVIDLAKFAAKHELADFLDGRRVKERVIHHQRQPAAVSFGDKMTYLFRCGSERLLHKYVLSGFQRSQRQLIVRMNRRRDRDDVYLWIAQELSKIRGNFHLGMTALA